VVLFWVCLLTRTSGHPAMPLTTVFVLCAGAVGWYAAHRQRRTLELFARLQLLKRYLPPAAVKRVLEKRTSTEALALGGQRVTLTIMATDLRRFTPMCENLSPEEVVAELNAYHGVMVDQIDRHGGLLDKFIGDGALAVFGFLPSGPVAPDAGSAAAIACARSMMDALLKLNESRGRDGRPALRMGIGVHTGDVVAGNIGAVQKRLEFTVIGDAVNTAARLESATEDLGVTAVASSATVDRIDDKRQLRALPSVQLKGKAGPVDLYAIDPMP
jgi:adenylate cyclase